MFKDKHAHINMYMCVPIRFRHTHYSMQLDFHRRWMMSNEAGIAVGCKCLPRRGCGVLQVHPQLLVG